MPKEPKDFLALVQEGKLDEARTLLAQEKEKAEHAPDTAVSSRGKAARFTRNGKAVELAPNGKWRPKAKK